MGVSHKFGTTILHLEMDEVTDRVAKISDADAQKTLICWLPALERQWLRQNMLYAAKVYMALHEIMKLNQLEVSLLSAIRSLMVSPT